MELYRRLEPEVRKIPQIPERGDSEGGDLEMLPESSTVEVFNDVESIGSDEAWMVNPVRKVQVVPAVYKEPASAIVTDASN